MSCEVEVRERRLSSGVMLTFPCCCCCKKVKSAVLRGRQPEALGIVAATSWKHPDAVKSSQILTTAKSGSGAAYH